MGVLETQLEPAEPASPDSDAPLRPKSQRNRRIISSTDSSIGNAAEKTTDKDNTSNTSNSGIRATPQPQHSAGMDVDELIKPSSEQCKTALEHYIKAGPSTPLGMNAAFADDERVGIHGERRSMRTPKRTTPFGDMISWPEANLQMQGLKPEAPKK